MSEKPLYDADALAKLRELAEAIDVAMLCTSLTAKPFHAVPMSTKKVGNDGSIWFLSGQDSNHNQHIAADGHVALLYSDPKSMQFLNVYGLATVHTSSSILDELYSSSDDAWFDGVEDPNLTALQISPMSAYYWDTKGNKLVALMKMGVATLTGQEPDIAHHGQLKV